MGILQRRYIMQFFIVQLFGCLGWLCNVALAQLDLSESVTGSINNLPNIGIAFVGNFAVFITSLLRGRLDLEMGTRDVLATLRGPKLYEINKGFGLTSCSEASEDRFREASVVMLSYNTPNSSMRQFMKYICNAYKVHSILLQCFPLKSKSGELLPGICNYSHDEKKCECIVFWNVEEIIMMLARRMPRKIKRMSDSLCLLPCPHCREKGCHGCNQGQYVYEEEIAESERKILTDDDINMGSKIVDDIFYYIHQQNPSQQSREDDHSCICIPLSPSGYDYWTKLLTRSFGATGNDERAYSTASLLVPRLTEVFLNLVLTVWFRVDGFSSSLVARRAIKDYVVDSKGSGFSANAFLTKTITKEQNNCQVLKFRPTILGIKTFSYMVGSFNLICSICWVVLVACQGSCGKWYDSHSKPPSKWRVVVIMIAIGIALGMDFLHLYLSRSTDSNSIEFKPIEPEATEPTELTVKVDSKEPPTELTVKVDSTVGLLGSVMTDLKMVKFHQRALVWAVIVLEMVCILSGSILLRISGIKFRRRWLYSALQALVWVKWITGSYLLGEYPPEYDSQYNYDNGIIVYSSAFLLNSILAGIQGNWHYSTSMES